jgi:Histidine kinase-like ATPase domain
MSAITPAGTELVLTSRQVNEWSDAVKTLGLVDLWPAGHSASFSTPPMGRSVPVCRHLATLWLDVERVYDEDARYIVQLVVSELMTNAIQHSKSERITSRLWKSGDQLFVEVRDQGGTPSVPHVTCADEGNDHSRGLALVAECVQGWGMELRADECVVWAAVPYASNETGCRMPATAQESEEPSGASSTQAS